MKPKGKMLSPSKRPPATKRVVVLCLLCLPGDILSSVVFGAGFLVAEHLGREGGREGRERMRIFGPYALLVLVLVLLMPLHFS